MEIEARATLDTFLTNAGGSSAPGDRVKMEFTGISITSVSFDYEIFPDGSCPKLTNCGGAGYPNLPDFKLFGDGVLTFQLVGLVPGVGGTYSGSPLAGHPELAPQLLGAGTWAFNAPVTILEFVDWPAKIGIDNLRLNPVPEPGSVVLVGSTTVLFLCLLRKRRKAKT